MFIVWGTKGYEKDLGTVKISGVCPNCHNEITMVAKQVGRKFTLFWIPLFSVSTSYYIVCPICHAGKEISKQEMKELLVTESNPAIE